jgi:hypothetical protein
MPTEPEPNAPSLRWGDEEQDHSSTTPSSDRVGRFEQLVLLNDVSSRESRVYRKSPCPPRARRSSIIADIIADFIEECTVPFGAHHPAASHEEFLARCHSERATRVSSLEKKLTSSLDDGECVLHTPNDGPEPIEAELHAMSPSPPVGRVGRFERFELLNDVTGRTSRVFRKSPCPPRVRGC